MQHTERVDHVERVGLELEFLGIHHVQARVEPFLLESLLGEFDATRSYVYAGHACPSASELEMVGPQPNADLKHLLAGEAFEAKRAVHPRLLFVPVALDSRKRCWRAKVITSERERTCGIPSPLILGCALDCQRPVPFALAQQRLTGRRSFTHAAMLSACPVGRVGGSPTGKLRCPIRMSETTQRVLLVCHATAATAAAAAARRVWGADGEGQPPKRRGGPVGKRQLGAADLAIDVVCYGRASADLPPPPGTALIETPLPEGLSVRRGVRMLASLRRRSYDAVAVSQPALGLSRARGLLLLFAFLVGGRRAVVLDPTTGQVVRPITARLAAVDVARWLVFVAISRVVSEIAAPPIERLALCPHRPRKPARHGSTLYLRTDIDLRTAPLRAGGSVAHTEGILLALRDRGNQVAFWSTGEVDGVPESMAQARLPVLLKGNLPTEIAELLSGLLQGCSPPRGFRPTGFIYQRYSLNNLAGVILSRRWGVPLVLEANGSEAKWRQDFATLRYPRLAYACERLILRNADVVAAVSSNAAEDLLAAGATRERLRIVPNGVTVGRFAGAQPAPLPDGFTGFVVCFVGLFYPWHGTRFLAEAFSLFHSRCPVARLLLVGDGEDGPVVRSLLERNGALEATHFTGLVPRTEAPRYMAAADVLVSPHANVHRFIGSPIKVFEYMAAGKPIVATRVGQIQEVLTDGETALLVKPEDAKAMAEAFERLHADRALGERLGRAARIEARSKHSWAARLASMLDGADVQYPGDGS